MTRQYLHLTHHPAEDFSSRGIEWDLFQILQAVKSTKKMCVPVNKLPPEILSRVLYHRSCGQDLISATHVCRYWRSTLISTPSLWKTFHFNRSSCDVDRTLTYLERSKAVPIDIHIGPHYPSRDLYKLQHISPHMSRMRSFTITSHPNIDIVSSLLLCQPVPCMERLIMDSSRPFVRPLHNFLGQHAPSLRSATFTGICPMLESPFQLPNLNELRLFIPQDAGSFRISLLFGFCSSCSQLRGAYIRICCKILEDVPLDQVILMDSLVELEYSCATTARLLPYLKLPRLNRLRVCLRKAKVDALARLLPHNGRTLLSGVTSMSLSYCGGTIQVVELSGKGIEASFTASNEESIAFSGESDGADSAHWFSDEAYIPFGQIEDLEFNNYYNYEHFPIHLFENLATFRMYPHDGRSAERVLGLLRPLPGAGVPCPSLHHIDCILGPYTSSDFESLVGSFINLVGERERAGCRLKSIHLLSDKQLDPGLEGELKGYVGELQVSGGMEL